MKPIHVFNHVGARDMYLHFINFYYKFDIKIEEISGIYVWYRLIYIDIILL